MTEDRCHECHAEGREVEGWCCCHLCFRWVCLDHASDHHCEGP